MAKVLPSAHPFYGNDETKVYHKEGVRGKGCRIAELKSRKPPRFATRGGAEKLGFRACKRCCVTA